MAKKKIISSPVALNETELNGIVGGTGIHEGPRAMEHFTPSSHEQIPGHFGAPNLVHEKPTGELHSKAPALDLQGPPPELHLPSDKSDFSAAPAKTLPRTITIDAAKHDVTANLLTASQTSKPQEALSHWFPESKSSSIEKSYHPEERFIETNPLSGPIRNIAENLISQSPQAMAETIKQRSAALEKDVETWSNWEKTTGNEKSKKLAILKDIQTKLANGTNPSAKEVLQQLERLNWVEQSSQKVPLVDALAFNYAKTQAEKLGISDPFPGLNAEHFGLETISKHLYENPASAKQYENGLNTI
ncbi:MAG: hypothetical protein O2897_01770 [bacterium]|nr:hypothetical protein [bacterium]